MKERKVSSQLDTDMGWTKRSAYVWSVLLAIGNVILRFFRTL